jgi:predicted dehydrogenase
VLAPVELMPPFQIASQTVSQALRTGQIGTPVAARVVAHMVADHGLVNRLLALALEATSQWLESHPAHLTAFGGADAGAVSTLVSFERGQTALVSVGSCGVGRPLLEVVLWGNRGMLSWEGDCGLANSADRAPQLPLSDNARDLLALVDASLETGHSVATGMDPARGGRGHPTESPRGSSAGRHRQETFSEPPLRRQQPPYGVLLITGDHTHQPNYAPALAADPRCKLIGLSDEADITPRRRRLNEQMARRLGIPLLGDLKAALVRNDVHVVSICAEPERRGPIIVQAAEAGKHLYLDKPLAGTVAEADQILSAVSRAGVVSHMWSMVRMDIASHMRQAIQSGSLGKLTAIHYDLCFAKGHAGSARLGQRRRESAAPNRYETVDSKRELTNVGVYPLVQLLWLLKKKVRRVSATTGNYFFQEHQANDMEDFGQMLLELEDGVVATISAGRTGWRSHPSSGLHRVCLMGTEHSMALDAHRPRLVTWADVEAWAAPPPDPEDPMGMWATPKRPEFTPRPKYEWTLPATDDPARDASYFFDCIEHGRQSDVSADLAADATEVLLAAYQSAASGDVVHLP